MVRKRTPHARERRALQEEIDAWRGFHFSRPDGPAEQVAEWREIVDMTHSALHTLLGPLADDEREAIWPTMDPDERASFDQEHKEWLHAELRRLKERLRFLHDAKEAAPSPQLDSDLAKVAQEWGAFVANCSRAEECALGLDAPKADG